MRTYAQPATLPLKPACAPMVNLRVQLTICCCYIPALLALTSFPSRAQSADRDNVTSVLNFARIARKPNQYSHEFWWPYLRFWVLADFVAHPFQIFDPFGHLVFAGFYLKCGPSAIFEFYDRVYFQSRIVSVIPNRLNTYVW